MGHPDLDARHRSDTQPPRFDARHGSMYTRPRGQEIVAARQELWQNSGVRLGVVYVLPENLLLQKLSGFTSLPFSFRTHLHPGHVGCRRGADVSSGTGAGHAATDAHD